MKILNLTQHKATPEQVDAGVVGLNEWDKRNLIKFLTFDEIPSQSDLEQRATSIVSLVSEWNDGVMIGGAPYLMASLEKALINAYFTPMYAFSKRESVEEVQPDGSTKKTAVFRHLGFVRVPRTHICEYCGAEVWGASDIGDVVKCRCGAIYTCTGIRPVWKYAAKETMWRGDEFRTKFETREEAEQIIPPVGAIIYIEERNTGGSSYSSLSREYVCRDYVRWWVFKKDEPVGIRISEGD